MSADLTTFPDHEPGPPPVPWAAADGPGPAVLAAVSRMTDAWGRGDAAGVAGSFIETGVLILPGNNYFHGRAAISAFTAGGFAGALAGTRFVADPVDLRSATGEVVLLRTHGGVVPAGAAGVEPELAVRTTWAAVLGSGRWLLSLSHSTLGPGAARK